MEFAEIAKKVDALKSELAAKSSRIAVLESRVSLLEAENARLRKAMPEGVATDRRGKGGPTFGQLEEGLGGSKRKPADIAGGHVMNDVIEISDGEEEGMAVDCSNGERAEEDVPAVPTPRNCAVLVVTGKSEAEDEIEDAGGCGERDHGSFCCDGNVILEDDDILVTPRGKKRAAARVVSDSESEDGDENDRGHGKRDVGVTSSRKRTLLEVSDSEREDGSEGVHVVSQKPVSGVVTTGTESENDDDELYEMEGCSTPATRRSTQSAKSQSKRMQPPRRQLEFIEPKDHEESEDGSEDGDSMDEFIVDSDSSENSADPDEESSAEQEEPDNEESYEDLMARIRGKRNAKNKDWKIEPEMLSAYAEHPELCLKAVCALYRKQTEGEQACKATIMHNKKGFNQIDARRGSQIAQFLLDGDASGPLNKTAQDLEKYDRYAFEFCHKMALRYSKQLFAIYQNKEDPYFP